jgi:hypothetical protein
MNPLWSPLAVYYLSQKSSGQAQKVKRLSKKLAAVDIREPLVMLVPWMGACVEWW